MSVEIRAAVPQDAAVLHGLAEATFGLACPPGTTQDAVDDFIATHLSETSFAGYLVDPARVLFLASVDDEPVGYAMLVFGEPTDADVRASITLRPTTELSKLYVVAGSHGAGVASALVGECAKAASARGCSGIWLGVNEHNARANRFYEKSGFATVGSKKFLVGGNWEDDFVRELRL